MASGLPFTILRATQFPSLVAGLFDAQRRLPERLFCALRAGHNTTHGTANGTVTFAEYLAARRR